MPLKLDNKITNAAANSLLSPQEQIISTLDKNVTIGAANAIALLGVGYPIAFNSSTGQYAPWVAPDPTVMVITLTGATGGTFTITVNGATTSALAYNASAAVVAAALLAIGYNATVTLDTLVYTITFDAQAEIATLPTVTADTSLLTGDVSETVTVNDGTAVIPDPTILNIDLEDRTGGTFAVVHGGNTITPEIAFAATAPEIEALILANIPVAPPASVTVTRATGANEISIIFDDLVDLLSLPTVSATLGNLTGGTGATALATVGNAISLSTASDVEVDVGSATGGTFTVTVDGTTTAGIAFDATAGEVDTALLAIGYTVSTGLVSTTYTITFDDKAEIITLPTITASIAGLTGVTAGVATAGTATNGLDEIRGFVNPEDIQTGINTGDITLTRVTTTATATTTNPHGLVTGMSLTVSGADNAAFNVTATITVTSTTVFTYAVADSGTTSDTGSYTTTNDIMALIMIKGRINASLPQSLVATGDVTALNTAMKNGLIGKGLIVEELVGTF